MAMGNFYSLYGKKISPLGWSNTRTELQGGCGSLSLEVLETWLALLWAWFWTRDLQKSRPNFVTLRQSWTEATLSLQSLLYSLRASSCAGPSHACFLNSCLERQLVPLESFHMCPYKPLHSVGCREDFTRVRKFGSHHRVALRSGRLLHRPYPLALPGEKAGCGNGHLLYRSTFTWRCRMNSCPYWSKEEHHLGWYFSWSTFSVR